ncbi:MAG: CsbD family protein [Pseudohongiellaceae bacterium]
MKNSTKNQIQGKVLEEKGKLKEVTGIMTGNKKLEREGKAEKIAGKFQKKVGDAEQVLEE